MKWDKATYTMYRNTLRKSSKLNRARKKDVDLTNIFLLTIKTYFIKLAKLASVYFS